MTEPTNLWWPMKMVHQIFIKGSAITTHFYYLVYIHQSSSIKCNLLLRPKNYWKIPSISALTRLEHTGNILFGQTQRDCLSEHLTSLPLQSLIFHIQCWENSHFFFLWMLLLVHHSSYSIPKVTDKVYITRLSLTFCFLSFVFPAVRNNYRITE